MHLCGVSIKFDVKVQDLDYDTTVLRKYTEESLILRCRQVEHICVAQRKVLVL